MQNLTCAQQINYIGLTNKKKNPIATLAATQNADFKMNANDAHSTRRHMTALIEYAKALRVSIQNINENSYNNFMMRIGKCVTPLC